MSLSSHSRKRKITDLDGLSDRQKRRIRTANEINHTGDELLVSCDDCLKDNLSCVMDPSKGVHCAECVRKGVPCVNFSWESLDRTRSTSKAAIVRVEQEILAQQEETARRFKEAEAAMRKQTALLARLARHRKVLELAEARANEKAVCLAKELEEEEEEERRQRTGEGPSTERESSLSEIVPTVEEIDWSLFDLGAPGDLGGTPQEPLANPQGAR